MRRICSMLIPCLLALGLFAVVCCPIHGEAALYDSVLRLHVLANSDSEADQALKLKVRDAVLEVTTPLVADCADRAQAAEALEQGMPQLYAAAEAVLRAEGCTDEVAITLTEEVYPERVYEACCFPAGTYLSLRIALGQAQGRNWWCVLFPPLCLSAATAPPDEEAFTAVGLTRDQYGVITEQEHATYKLRFKILEVFEDWWG